MPSQEGLSNDQEIQELSRLLHLINTPASKQQLPSLQFDSTKKTGHWLTTQPQGGAHQQLSTEAFALEQFSIRYQNVRVFCTSPSEQIFLQIFEALIKNRLSCRDWSDRAPAKNVLRMVTCLRMFLRDEIFQKNFYLLGGAKMLSEYLIKTTGSYLSYGPSAFLVDILKEITNICQKLTAGSQQRERLLLNDIHKPLVLLLSSSDVVLLHCSLHALILLAQSKHSSTMIVELNAVEMVVDILQSYDPISRKLAANLLRLLCGDDQTKEQIKIYEGVSVLLSLLHSDDIHLLWHVVWILTQLAEDLDISNEMRILGGIPLLLALLHDRKLVLEDSITSGQASANARIPPQTLECGDDISHKHMLALQAACCAALTELTFNDHNAHQIVQANGIFSIGLLILPQIGDEKAVENLQKSAFRAMRFLFSMERNRQLFKRLFPVSLFELFIDVGHYQRDLSAYQPMVSKINSLPKDELAQIQDNIHTTNQNKKPMYHVGAYAVMELLGTGAFGSVYKVKKRTASGQSNFAMKEIALQHPALGKSSKEKEQSLGELINETNIIREHLKHPSVVRYHKIFTQNDKLYIVMELIEGAPLGEHFNSLKEKKTKFSEERIWNIFIQIVLALRYLHKDKGIVHRDLTPNNIMLGENDKVTITDFGLARQKREDCSKMTSVVGTILYNCPEIVQSLPYGEKADIWALGCILYQMCSLQAPFYSNNMLALATKIVEGDYDAVPSSDYSERMRTMIRRCLTVDPELRPDIIEVGSMIADILMIHMDLLRFQQQSLERKLEKERKRTQRHFMEAHHNMQNYQRLFMASQENKEGVQVSSQRVPWNNSGSQTVECDISDSNHLTAHQPIIIQTGGPKLKKSETEGSVMRAHSSSVLEGLKKATVLVRPRPPSATSTLTISPRKVRQINDPILQLLHQLHKIIYITQLPPTLTHNPRRRVVERFKRALFSPQSSSVSLKNEIKKVVTGSRESIDLDFRLNDSNKKSTPLECSSPAFIECDYHDICISYEQLQNIIESVLIESGYYDMTSSRNYLSLLRPINKTPDFNSL